MWLTYEYVIMYEKYKISTNKILINGFFSDSPAETLIVFQVGSYIVTPTYFIDFVSTPPKGQDYIIHLTPSLFSKYPKSVLLEVIVENIKSDRVAELILFEKSLNQLIADMSINGDSNSIPIINESPFTNLYIIIPDKPDYYIHTSYDSDISHPYHLHFNIFYFVVNDKMYRHTRRVDAFTWTHDGKLLIMEYLPLEKSFEFVYYWGDESGERYRIQTKLNITNIVNQFGELNYSFTGITSDRASSEISISGNHIWFSYGYNKDKYLTITFNINDHSNMIITDGDYDSDESSLMTNNVRKVIINGLIQYSELENISVNVYSSTDSIMSYSLKNEKFQLQKCSGGCVYCWLWG